MPTATASDDGAADPQKAAVIRQILTATQTSELFKKIIATTLPQTVAMIRQNSVFPPGFVDEAQAKFSERFKSIDVAQIAIPVYSKSFSLQELKQILAFDQSATGQKLARLQPEMLLEVTAKARAMGQQIGRDVTREILAEHPEYVREMEENHRAMQGRTVASAPVQEGPAYAIGNGVTPPQVIAKQEPQYTPEAISSKTEGSVLLSIIVDKAGMPQHIRIIRPLGSGLDGKAVEAVRQWRFKPGTMDGEAVATWANIEVNFRLLDKARRSQ